MSMEGLIAEEGLIHGRRRVLSMSPSLMVIYHIGKVFTFTQDDCKVCLISPGTDLPGEWALLALGSVPGLLRQTLNVS